MATVSAVTPARRTRFNVKRVARYDKPRDPRMAMATCGRNKSP